jgi:hypothetical protein
MVLDLPLQQIAQVLPQVLPLGQLEQINKALAAE